eukprot:112272-Chlamydomonas_euryale.AAC.1
MRAWPVSIAPSVNPSQTAEESGSSNVSRLDEALARTAARLDRAKQQLYFPAVKGYRCGPSCHAMPPPLPPPPPPSQPLPPRGYKIRSALPSPLNLRRLPTLTSTD